MVASGELLVIDWNDLRHVLAVARFGTLSAAARELRVTQPTVGRRIAALERRLDARLFVRTREGWAPTDAGRAVLEHAQKMAEHAVAAENLVAGRDAGIAGTVRITASEWLVRSVLAPSLGALVEKHPSLALELVADPRHLNLVQREADVAIRPSPFAAADVHQRALGAMRFGLYASEAYLERRGTPDFESGAEGHDVVALTDDMNGVVDYEWLPRITGRARVVVRTNGREPLATMALAGVGLACLPRALGDAMPGLKRLRPALAAPERTLWMGVHRSVRTIPRVRATLAFVAERFAKLRAFARR